MRLNTPQPMWADIRRTGWDSMPAKTSPTNGLKFRKETKEWLARRTIPNVRAIAKDLENAGEDARDLQAAIDDLERLLKEGPAKSRGRDAPKQDRR